MELEIITKERVLVFPWWFILTAGFMKAGVCGRRSWFLIVWLKRMFYREWWWTP
jgi:hypothetical protein